MRAPIRNYLRFGLWIAFSFVFARGSVLAQTVVTVASEAALRDAMAKGGWVRCDFNGTITLSNTIDVTLDVTLDAQGRSVVISGNNSNRIFTVESGVTFSATNVVLANGRHVGASGQTGQTGSPGQGGAIYSVGGTIQLVSCALLSNSVTGGLGGGSNGGDGQGGAIFLSGGSLLLDSVMVSSNTASGGGPQGDPAIGGSGFGGAIYAADGTVRILSSILTNNVSAVPTIANGAAAFGGALYQESGSVTFSNSTLAFNGAVGNKFFNLPPQKPGVAYGGAIAVLSGTTTIERCRVTSNLAQGGVTPHFWYPGLGKAQGGAIWSRATLRASDSTFAGNQAVSGFGPSDDGCGGAIYSYDNSGLAELNRCSFVSNLARGSSASDNAPGVHIPAGNGLGGAIFNIAQLNMTNCTVALNFAQGGDAVGFFGPGGVEGTGAGGGIYNTGTGAFTAVNVTIASNSVAKGHDWTPTNTSGFALGANVAVASGTIWLRNSILAYPGTNDNAWGTITDGGYNMSSDGAANFNSGTSFNFTDPRLQGLADNGGPTLTMALPPDKPIVWSPGQAKGFHHTSPAVDFGTADGAPTTDQRGFARPSGLKVDMGAYELQASPIQPPLLTQSRLGDGQWLSFLGQWTATYVLQKSTDLMNWTDIEVMGPFGSDAQVNLTNNVGNSAMEFFRLRVQ